MIPQIDLTGYTVYGMCQYGGSLDYVIAIDDNSQELRVIRLQYNLALNMSRIIDYKMVDKAETLILSSINVDCQMTQQFLGSNTYVIAIVGQYFQPNLLSNYYLAKFSTKYNLTEYFVMSNDMQTMEIPKLVKVDPTNQKIYVALEINKNLYHNRTVYAPGELPPIDNSNVAIVAYSWIHGTRSWVTVVGDKNLVDSFADMQPYGGYLYVVVNSFSTKYSSNSSQTDINYYRMRFENGYIVGNSTFGSPTDDKVFDIVITYAGVYMLGIIGSPFQPNRYNSKQWATQNSNPNIVVIVMDFNDQILDIEGYDLSLSSTISPYPQRMFVTRAHGTAQYYIFITHRTNNVIDLKGGIFLTYFTNPALVYQQTTSCSVSCLYCNPQDTTKCLQCQPGYFLFQYMCYASACPQFTYGVVDQGLKPIQYCLPCHYSCLTCTGPSSDQCSSCCQNAYCGASYDRVPNLGQCNCPNGTSDSNGVCNFQCSLNLQGRLNQQCYTQCPTNSYPLLMYDQATAQETTSNFASSCQNYQNDLTFQKSGYGLAVSGPGSLQSMPLQFTVSFWIFLTPPTPLNVKSTFINAFGRIKIYSTSSSQYIYYNFMTGASTFVQPTYATANQSLALGTWNYVTVSQRQIQSGTSLFYEIQIALSQSNTGTVLNTAYTNSQPVINYAAFTNIIYLGADSDINPGSFSGYLKEVKIFNVFHSYAQMVTDQAKLYRLYSYDDPTLISYWKLSENYNSSNIQYTIYDYSINQQSLTFSTFADPNYPTFTVDTNNQLTLCTITDVRVCQSLDYSKTSSIHTSSARLMTPPTLNLLDSSYKKQNNDQLWYMPNNTACNISQVIALMNYSSASQSFIVPNVALTPLNIQEGTHLQLCYYIASMNVAFNLVQLYLAAPPRTVDPSNGNIYNRTGNVMQWMTGGGDQAYGDVIRFSTECSTPQLLETEIMRQNDPSYNPVIIFGGFKLIGDFYFCWYPVFAQDLILVPYFEYIYNLKFVVQGEPQLSATTVTTANMNEDMVLFNIKGTFLNGDKLTMAWGGVNYSDCNPNNFMGYQYTFNYSYWPALWMGYTTGIHGVNSYLFFNDELQLCWQPSATQAPLVFIRVKKDDLKPYVMRYFKYNNTYNQLSPELVSFYPEYGSATLQTTDTMIKFNFKPMHVYPSKYVYNYTLLGVNYTNISYGRIIMYRGAIMQDGTIVKLDNQIFWGNVQLDDAYTPDPLQQGSLICSQTGQCGIVLSSISNQIKSGEVYYLSFFPFSFSNIVNNQKYFLFANKNIPMTQSAYDHMFFCRSFSISQSNAIINGVTLTISGTNLLSNQIYAKYVGGLIQTDTFYTKAINFYFTVYNTDNEYCTDEAPIGTVAIEDVTNTQLTIKNLDLRGCNDGQLFADIQVIRGIKDQYGQFTYVRAEKIYNVEIGTIGCDNSCLMCNGTTSSNCQVCAIGADFLYMGVCYPTCPSIASFHISTQVQYQSIIQTQKVCVQQCPFQYYPDPVTGNCLACNAECQTCNSSLIASCLSCNPVAYLFNGICLDECPAPHHVDNYTDYVCHQVSTTQHLQVKIQSLGYLSAVPKNYIMYLKADINNTGGGNISSILWTQIEPDASSDPTISIFSADTDGTHNFQSSIVRINNNALMKIQLTQVVKVMVRVNNTAGETQYDIYEFYLNDPPNTGNITLKFVGEGQYSLGSAVTSQVMVNLTNWYDTPDDTSQMLKLSAYIILQQQVGTVTEITQMTLTEQLSQNVIYLHLPPLSNNFTSANVTFCIMGEDKFSAKGSYCIVQMNVNNNLSYTQDYSLLSNLLVTLNYTQNMSNVLFAAQSIFMGVQLSLRSNSQPDICSLDAHCSYNGTCDTQTGISKCICNQGFYGTYCQFQEYELMQFQEVTQIIIQQIYNNVTSLPLISDFAIELIGNVVRGVCSQPDFVTDANLEIIIQLLEMVSNANTYSQQTVDFNVTNIILQAYSNAIMKISHSNKLSKALPANVLAALGYSILNQQGDSPSSRRRLLSSFIQNTQEKISDLKKENLIGGRKKQQSKGRRLQTSEMSAQDLQYQDWGRRIDASFNTFINKVAWKLDPNNNEITLTTNALELYIQHVYSTSVSTQSPYYINNNDAYWIIPTNIFQNQHGVASQVQEVKVKLLKYISNPFQFETNPGAHFEQNLTSVEFFTQGGAEIPIDLTGLNTYIDQREPLQPGAGFELEQLKCMMWDEDQYTFLDDGTCGFSFQILTLPQKIFDPFTQVTTQISQCRCSHLTRFGAVYELAQPSSGVGTSPGIYSNFFAMAYWRQSFGIYAVIAGMTTFITIHIIIMIVDQRLQKNLIIQLKEKVRKFEIQYGTTVRKLDGMFFIPERQQAKYAKKKKFTTKKGQLDEEKGLLKGNSNEDDADSNGTKEALSDDKDMKPSKKAKKKIPNKKKFKQDADQVEPDSEASVQVPVKGKKPFIKKGGGKQAKGPKPSEELVNAEMESEPRIHLHEETKEGDAESVVKGEPVSEEKKDEIPDYLTEVQKEQLKNQREVFERISKARDKDHLHHILLRIQGEEIQGMTKKEFKKSIMREKNQFKGDQKDDLEEKFEDLCNQLNSTDEEIYQGLKSHFKEEEEQRLEKKMELKNMLIEGSHILSIFFVTSILCPRHVRWSLAFASIVLLWFITAVIFNNTQDPLQVPDLVSKIFIFIITLLQKTAASSQALSSLWIGCLSPVGCMVLMYIVSSFLKIESSQILYCSTNKQLDLAMQFLLLIQYVKNRLELKQQMRIQFLLGYGILFVVYGTIFWYVIKFTANFGWKVSWIWWYCGCFAILLQFFVIDPLAALIHYKLYKFNKKLGHAIMACRRIKQGQCEILANPFEQEEEEVSDGEGGKISKKKKTKKGGLFGGMLGGSKSKSKKNSKDKKKKKTFIEENTLVEKINKSDEEEEGLDPEHLKKED